MPESAEKPEALSFRVSPVSLAYPPYPGALAGVASLARGSTHKPALPTDTRRTKAFPYTKRTGSPRFRSFYLKSRRFRSPASWAAP